MKQCKIIHQDSEMVIWVDENFAKVGSTIVIKNDKQWKIVKVYNTIIDYDSLQKGSKNVYYFPWEITKVDNNTAFLKTDKERYLEYIKRNISLPINLSYLKE